MALRKLIFMKFYFSLVFLLVSLITCKNHETHEIVDNLILSSIIEQKYKIKIEQYYQDNLDDLLSILTQLELDIKEKTISIRLLKTSMK